MAMKPLKSHSGGVAKIKIIQLKSNIFKCSVVIFVTILITKINTKITCYSNDEKMKKNGENLKKAFRLSP